MNDPLTGFSEGHTASRSYALVCVDIRNEAVDRLFYYAVQDDQDVQPGMRVKVPFGSRSKPIDGYVMSISAESCLPLGLPISKIKPIDSLYEDYPVFKPDMLELAKWMKDKYYTTLASCLKCVLPPIPKSTVKKKKDADNNISESDRSTESDCGKKSGRNIKSDRSMLSTSDLPVLNPDQELALNGIYNNGEHSEAIKYPESEKRPILLHGVTGSGKTEVYIRAIAKVLDQNKQAIVLVPEIALTPQTVSVFRERFGDAAAVTHSRMTAKERFMQWQKAHKGEVSVMIGPRSAVFAPFDRLGIIIIDEEHEHTYRSEVTPKYDTRSVAIKRAELTGAQVVMGSATPSLETYHNSDYQILEMPKRINGMFPDVKIIDMRRELAQGNTSVFGRAFQEAAAETLNAGRQIILFLNRRGHSSFVSCRQCGHVMGCDRCRVNYTYHATSADISKLLCHYCGKSENIPHICPACQSPYIRYFGVGTQKVEEEVAKLFPDYVALRMDMDTTRRKQAHSKILTAFRKNEAQILIGTQMIAKGLDFPNVTLVGIVSADLSLFSGDFRAAEHTFSLLVQVSGRAGRADKSGQVYIQTYNPEHYSIQLAQDANYLKFYEHELVIRRTMNYPPFSHVFMVLFTGVNEPAIIKALHKLLAIMQYCNKKGMFEMLGPAPAFVSMIKKQFRWRLLVKCTQEEILVQFVLYCLGKLKENDPLSGIGIHLTLDPATIE